MLSKKYKSLLKEELKERAKNDPDYEEGKWEKLDRLLKEWKGKYNDSFYINKDKF